MESVAAAQTRLLFQSVCITAEHTTCACLLLVKKVDCKLKTESLKKGLALRLHCCMPESAEIANLPVIYHFVSKKRSSALECTLAHILIYCQLGDASIAVAQLIFIVHD